MNSYSLDDLGGALSRLEIARGSVVLMHSSLLHLGRLEGYSVRDTPAALIGCIRSRLGETGTLLTPAFNFNFCRGHAFDRRRTPSQGMGVLSEALRTWPDSHRSRHPTQSVSAVGKLAMEISDDAPVTSFSSGSVFQRLLDLDARVLLVGVDFQAASLIHMAEERLEVPYRYFKYFSGQYIDGELTDVRRYGMFVRDMSRNPRLVMSPVEQKLRAEGQLLLEQVGAGLLRSCGASDLVDCATALLRRNPECLLAPESAGAGGASKSPAAGVVRSAREE